MNCRYYYVNTETVSCLYNHPPKLTFVIGDNQNALDVDLELMQNVTPKCAIRAYFGSGTDFSECHDAVLPF